MKKVLKNIIASVFPQIVAVITGLILPGMIIVKFGSEVNGLVSTTKTIVSYISLVGAGIATAVTQSFYEPVARRDDLRVKGMLKAANHMFNKYGLIYCAITLLISLVYPLAIDSKISYSTISCLLLVVGMYGASEFFAIGRSRALLYANQQVYVSSIIQAISLILGLFLALLMLKISNNIILVQFSISFAYVLRGLMQSYYIRKHYPQYRDYNKVQPINEALSKRKDAMVHQLSGLVVNGSQAAIITSFVNLQAASIYSVYNIIFSGLQLISSNLSTAITPLLGRQRALGQREKLIGTYDIVEFCFFYLVTFLYSVTSVMIIPFIRIYTKNADINYVYQLFATLFVISSAFYILKLPSTAMVNVAGHFKETKWRAIAEAFICVAVSIPAVIIIGKEGVLVGSICALGWRCFDTILYVNKNILEISNRRSLIRLIKTFALIAVYRGISGCIMFTPSNYFDWALMAIITSAVVLLSIAIVTLLTDRKTLKAIFLRIIRKKTA